MQLRYKQTLLNRQTFNQEKCVKKKFLFEEKKKSYNALEKKIYVTVTCLIQNMKIVQYSTIKYEETLMRAGCL